MSVGNKIKESRVRLNLTQKELAEQLHVSRQTISNWEVERSYPDIESLIVLSDIFDLSIDKLLKEDVNMVTSLKKRKILDVIFYSILLGLVLGSCISVLVDVILNRHFSWSLIVCASCMLAATFISVFKASKSLHLIKAGGASVLVLLILLYTIKLNFPETNLQRMVVLSLLWSVVIMFYLYLIELSAVSFWNVINIGIVCGMFGNILTNIILDRSLLSFDMMITVLTNSITIVVIAIVNKLHLDNNKLNLLLTTYRDYTQKKEQ